MYQFKEAINEAGVGMDDSNTSHNSSSRVMHSDIMRPTALQAPDNQKQGITHGRANKTTN